MSTLVVTVVVAGDIVGHFLTVGSWGRGEDGGGGEEGGEKFKKFKKNENGPGSRRRRRSRYDGEKEK